MLLLKVGSKLPVKRIPIGSDKMDKMQIDLLASGVFPWGGMHNIKRRLGEKIFIHLFNGAVFHQLM